MAKSTSRTKPCSPAVRAGRLAKARQFGEAADMIDALVSDESELADAFITLCIHAGIASADVICCARLGEHAHGQDHHDAIALVERVDKSAAKHLAVLLDMKTRSGYSPISSSSADRRRARRAAQSLIESAERTR
jgi:hypothetical protein